MRQRKKEKGKRRIVCEGDRERIRERETDRQTDRGDEGV